MPLKTFKPMTPGRRFMAIVDRSSITKQKPEKRLTRPKRRIDGRNNQGRITVRFRGGGHKRKYRIIDFRRDKDGVPGKISAIEYDPNRSARIALIHYLDGEKRYVLASSVMKVGDPVLSGESVDVEPGNSLSLGSIPEGSTLHNIELKPGKGGQLARAAGTSATLLAKEGKYGHVRLPSGEVRLVNLRCRATIGQVGNSEHNLEKFGKAGRTRWLGRRPHNRGMVMNPCDHPHGGGEGRSKGGKHPQSPTGIPAKGFKTRKKKKYSNWMIVHRRK